MFVSFSLAGSVAVDPVDIVAPQWHPRLGLRREECFSAGEPLVSVAIDADTQFVLS
jgi:hypothetical protein